MKTGIDPRRVVTRLAQSLPARWRRRLGPAGDWLDMMLVDHGIIRAVYGNRHWVSAKMMRSAQPSPADIKALAAKGLKTIINLRGARDCGSYILEAKACEQHGVALVDFPLNSRTAPSAQHIAEAQRIFDTIAYPALMHCKSGADRAGVAAALYLYLHEREPLDTARKQLSLAYGHVKQGKTGVLDHFFDTFEKVHAETGVSLMQWVMSEDYDHLAMTRDFRGTMLGNVLTEMILRRE